MRASWRRHLQVLRGRCGARPTGAQLGTGPDIRCSPPQVINRSSTELPLTVSYDKISLGRLRFWIHMQDAVYSLQQFGEGARRAPGAGSRGSPELGACLPVRPSPLGPVGSEELLCRRGDPSGLCSMGPRHPSLGASVLSRVLREGC